MTLQPMGSKILIEAKDVEETTEAGLYIPTVKGQKKQIATVVAVGEGHLLENGEVKPLTVQIGDEVIYEKFAGTNIQYQGKNYLVIDERDILVRIFDTNMEI